MVVYHLLFDLAHFYEWNIPVTGDAWMMFVRITASLFFLLIGICFVISWSRRCLDMRQHVIPSSPSVGEGVSRDNAGATRHDTFLFLYKKYLRRGLLIFAGGMLITLVTYLFSPEFYVKFGVLHFIGVSTLLLPFFVPFKQWNFLLGIFVLLVPPFIGRLNPSTELVPSGVHPFLFPLPAEALLAGRSLGGGWAKAGFGFPPTGFSSLDYYPLLPWFGVILLGTAVGTVLYSPKRHQALGTFDFFPFPRWLLACGKRSLWIYFAHQPVILLILSLILGLPVHG